MWGVIVKIQIFVIKPSFKMNGGKFVLKGITSYYKQRVQSFHTWAIWTTQHTETYGVTIQSRSNNKNVDYSGIELSEHLINFLGFYHSFINTLWPKLNQMNLECFRTNAIQSTKVHCRPRMYTLQVIGTMTWQLDLSSSSKITRLFLLNLSVFVALFWVCSSLIIQMNVQI